MIMEKKVVEIWDSLLSSDEKSSGAHRVSEVVRLLFIHTYYMVWNWLSLCSFVHSCLPQQQLQLLDSLLAPDIAQYKGRGWSFTQFKIEIRLDVPHQPNGYDCGLFVMDFMTERPFAEMSQDVVFTFPSVI